MSVSSLLLAFLAPVIRAKPDREAEVAGLKIDLADAGREIAAWQASYAELARTLARARDETNELRARLRALTIPREPPQQRVNYEALRCLIPERPLMSELTRARLSQQMQEQMQALQASQRPGQGISYPPFPPPNPMLVSQADWERMYTCTPSRSDALTGKPPR